MGFGGTTQTRKWMHPKKTHRTDSPHDLNSDFVKISGNEQQKRLLCRIARGKPEFCWEHGAGPFVGETTNSRAFPVRSTFLHKIRVHSLRVRSDFAWTWLVHCALVAVVGLAGWGGAGCSLSLDFDECVSEADCAKGQLCSDEGYCVLPGSGGGQVALTGGPCEAVYGPADAPNVFLIGAMLPLDDAQLEQGVAMERGAMLAVDEINLTLAQAEGSPQIALVLCNSSGSIDQAEQAATHLSSIGVRGAVGPALDAPLAALGAAFAAPGSPNNDPGMVLVSPAATSPSVTALDDGQAVYRTILSATEESEGVRLMLQNPTGSGLPESLRVVVLYKQQADSVSIQQSIAGRLTGQIDATYVAYPDPADTSVENKDFGPAFSEIYQANPNVIVLVGGNEGLQIIGWVEWKWREAVSKNPSVYQDLHWILTSGGKREALFTEIEKYDELDLANVTSRIQGVEVTSAKGPAYDGFSTRLASAFDFATPPSFAAHAYDAVYVLAYAWALHQQGSTDTPTAQDLISAIAKLTSGVDVAAGDAGSLAGVWEGTLSTSTINLSGASGKLDFDSAGDVTDGALARFTPNPVTRAFDSAPLIQFSTQDDPRTAGD